MRTERDLARPAPGAPTSRSSTPTRHLRPAAATSSCARSPASSGGAAGRSRRTGSPAGPRVPLQLLQLRPGAAAAVRPRRRAARPPRRRADRRLPRIRRRHRRADRRDERASSRRRPCPVALQPRRAPPARHRARRPGRDHERARSGDLPSAGRAGSRSAAVRCASSRSSWSDNPRKGADVLRALGAYRRPGPLRADVRRPHAGGATGLEVVAPLASEELAETAPRHGLLRRLEPRRPVLERVARGARLRPAGALSPKRRPPGARRRGRRGLRRAGRCGRRRSTGWRPSLEACRGAIVVPSLGEVADRYLEVLRG